MNYYLVSEGAAKELGLDEAMVTEWDGTNSVLVSANSAPEALRLAALYDQDQCSPDNLPTSAGVLLALDARHAPRPSPCRPIGRNGR